MKLAQSEVACLLGLPSKGALPKQLTLEQCALLQSWRHLLPSSEAERDASPWLERLKLARDAGTLATHVCKVVRQVFITGPAFPGGFNITLPVDRLVDVAMVESADFSTWLAAINETPSPAVRAWTSKETSDAVPAPSATIKPIAPAEVKVESTSDGARKKRWTSDELAKLKEYRSAHRTKAAAEKFGISRARVRQLLPGDKPPRKGFSVFKQD